MFEDRAGHVVDTIANRQMMLETLNPDYFVNIDEFNTITFARLLADGTEMWIETQIGEALIRDRGINLVPRYH